MDFQKRSSKDDKKKKDFVKVLNNKIIYKY